MFILVIKQVKIEQKTQKQKTFLFLNVHSSPNRYKPGWLAIKVTYAKKDKLRVAPLVHIGVVSHAVFALLSGCCLINGVTLSLLSLVLSSVLPSVLWNTYSVHGSLLFPSSEGDPGLVTHEFTVLGNVAVSPREWFLVCHLLLVGRVAYNLDWEGLGVLLEEGGVSGEGLLSYEVGRCLFCVLWEFASRTRKGRVNYLTLSETSYFCLFPVIPRPWVHTSSVFKDICIHIWFRIWYLCYIAMHYYAQSPFHSQHLISVLPQFFKKCQQNLYWGLAGATVEYKQLYLCSMSTTWCHKHIAVIHNVLGKVIFDIHSIISRHMKMLQFGRNVHKTGK